MRDNYGRLYNRSPLLAQILQQMQQNSQYQPQSYGALAAGLGAAYFDKKNLDKELSREQEQKQAQGQALAKELSQYTQQSQGGPTNIPLGNVDGGTEQLQQNYMADPQGARQNLMGSLTQNEHPMAQALAGQLMSQQFAQQEQKVTYIDAGDYLLEAVNGVPTGRRIEKGASPDAKLNQEGADRRHITPSGDVAVREAGEESRFGRVSGSSKYSADNASENRGIKDTRALRKEYRSLPSVRDYETALPIINSAYKAPDNGFGDLQLIYSVGKLLDPNSVVREGELALTLAANSPLQRIIGATRFTTEKGGRLTPQAREQIIEMLNERVSGYQQAYERDYNQYSEYALEQGAEPESIVGTRADSAFAPNKKTGAITIQGKDEYEKLPSGALYTGPDGKTRRKP